MTRIVGIDLGFDTCYVLQASGVIVVDAGQPKKARAFLAGLSRASIRPEAVQLILLTHAHWDHMGSAAELERITGAPLAVHEKEVGWVEQGNPPLPPGVTPWGRAFVGDLAMNRLPLRASPGLPIFADDLAAVIRSWRRLLELGVNTVYPAHGKPFDAGVMRRVLAAA